MLNELKIHNEKHLNAHIKRVVNLPDLISYQSIQ